MAQDFSVRLNSMPEGWLQAMGVTITKATADERASWHSSEKCRSHKELIEFRPKFNCPVGKGGEAEVG